MRLTGLLVIPATWLDKLWISEGLGKIVELN